MTKRAAFTFGFICGTFFLLGMCVGCSADQRQGHRVEFSVDRMQLDADSAASSSAVGGPGPHDAASSSSGGGDMSGWQYGVAYSIPLGDDPAASETRILAAQVGGMRAELDTKLGDVIAAIDRQTEATNGLIESIELGRRHDKPSESSASQQDGEGVAVLVAPASTSSTTPSLAATPSNDEPADDNPWAKPLKALGIGGGAAGLIYVLWTFRGTILAILPFGKH